MFRTNYQRRYSSFRDKPEHRPMSDKYLRDELDAIVRLILPLIESCCFTCGSQYGLQVGHLFERRHTHTRWDTTIDGNNHLQCAPCNKNHEAKPAIYQDKFIDRFGERAYADLGERAHCKQKVDDLMSILEEKQNQLKKLKGTR
jgi:hypothetical protein